MLLTWYCFNYFCEECVIYKLVVYVVYRSLRQGLLRHLGHRKTASGRCQRTP